MMGAEQTYKVKSGDNLTSVAKQFHTTIKAIQSANSLTTNTWYNHRGLVVKVSPPGGLVTKTIYDNAGRPTAVYSW